MLGHEIVSQHFMEPEYSIPKSQELSTCSYPEPHQSSAHHLIPPLQDPPTYVLVFLVVSFPLAFLLTPYTRSSSPPFVLLNSFTYFNYCVIAGNYVNYKNVIYLCKSIFGFAIYFTWLAVFFIIQVQQGNLTSISLR
jgi:hypothetical protein